MSVSFFPRRFALLCSGIALSSLTATAHAFADDDARRAILDLRQQLSQVTQNTRQTQMQLADQIENIRQELAQMRGELERVRWEVDFDKRAGFDQSATSSIQVDNMHEQRAFDNALGLFRSGKYKEAAAGFTAFLTDFPQSQLRHEAQFYLGGSLYSTKQFKESIERLQRMVQENPSDSRAADALLIVAGSQIELNDLAGATRSLRQIIDDYPDSSAAETAKSRLELLQ